MVSYLPNGMLAMLNKFNTSTIYPVGNISPITMDSEWSRSNRAIFLSISAIFGLFFTGCFIASYFIIRVCYRDGKCNAYMALTGFFDFVTILTCFSFSYATLITEQEDRISCYILQLIIMITATSYNILSMFSAMHDLQAARNLYQFHKINIREMIYFLLFTFFLVIAISSYGTVSQSFNDFCTRSYKGSNRFQIYFFFFYHLLPFFLTMYCYFDLHNEIKRHARIHVAYRCSYRYNMDRDSAYLNLGSYIFFVACWTPFIIVTWVFPDTSDDVFYMTAWIGVYRSVLTGFLYGIYSEEFTDIYFEVMLYMCCKTSMRTRMLNRQRQDQECCERDEEGGLQMVQNAVPICDQPTRLTIESDV